MVNTALDLGLFWLLQPSLGVLAANLLSTSAGMACSFVLNGRWTFRARLTRATATRFLATTGTTMWLLQPAAITLLHAAGTTLPVAKLLAIGVSITANFAGYRLLVWRPAVENFR